MVRRVVVAVLAAAAAALLIGVPTGIVETPWFTRMTPVQWWNYPTWALSAVLTGALAATYVRPPGPAVPQTGGGKTLAANMLTLLAVGCPVCNKLVVLALGMTGAMAWFAPVQPVLAAVSLALLAYALWGRRRAAACALPARAVPSRQSLHS